MKETVGDGVQLVLRCEVVATLAVLDERDQQERDHRRGRVDLQLVLVVQERQDASADQDQNDAFGEPGDHEEQTEGEERGATREEGRAASEAVEESDAP